MAVVPAKIHAASVAFSSSNAIGAQRPAKVSLRRYSASQIEPAQYQGAAGCRTIMKIESVITETTVDARITADARCT